MGRYDANKPYTWLSCLPDPVAGCVTSDQLKAVFGNDERIVTTLDKDSLSRERTPCSRSTASSAPATPRRSKARDPA